ncbi:hypothetical protein AAHE18_11G024600 [Arachis hypogaea]
MVSVSEIQIILLNTPCLCSHISSTSTSPNPVPRRSLLNTYGLVDLVWTSYKHSFLLAVLMKKFPMNNAPQSYCYYE